VELIARQSAVLLPGLEFEMNMASWHGVAAQHRTFERSGWSNPLDQQREERNSA
jgi:hypothetical protein